jgi:hypothetical protein
MTRYSTPAGSSVRSASCGRCPRAVCCRVSLSRTCPAPAVVESRCAAATAAVPRARSVAAAVDGVFIAVEIASHAVRPVTRSSRFANGRTALVARRTRSSCRRRMRLVHVVDAPDQPPSVSRQVPKFSMVQIADAKQRRRLGQLGTLRRPELHPAIEASRGENSKALRLISACFSSRSFLDDGRLLRTATLVRACCVANVHWAESNRFGFLLVCRLY